MVKETSFEVINQIEKTIEKIDDSQVQRAIDAILQSKRIFVVGSGRSGLAARSFAHRIVDLGFDVFVVGETITPSAKKDDIIIAVSGSGETTFTLNVVEIGKKIGAKIIGITSYPKSPMGKLADVIIHLPGRVITSTDNKRDYLTRQITGVHEPLTPKGAVFELATLVFFEALIIKLKALKA